MACRFNEETREFEDVPIRFTVAGQERSDEYYMVMIPARYQDLFEGHDFPNLEIFRRSLMHASVASEAFEYRRPWVQEDAERSMKKCLELK